MNRSARGQSVKRSNGKLRYTFFTTTLLDMPTPCLIASQLVLSLQPVVRVSAFLAEYDNIDLSPSSWRKWTWSNWELDGSLALRSVTLKVRPADYVPSMLILYGIDLPFVYIVFG